ncbi:hypothetical protein CKAH01_03705 [Colletotrichum kahawae]|uniref:Uncharacterized protein n=1 Tax=Colletotrichum kahawae TaxID=34407 RepID=A0AAE0DBX4_COLKA|nr:hypothetical protein CKAH01_03705 [Colletotrichum kahawae]
MGTAGRRRGVLQGGRAMSPERERLYNNSSNTTHTYSHTALIRERSTKFVSTSASFFSVRTCATTELLV